MSIFKKVNLNLTSADGKKISVWELDLTGVDSSAMSSWAKRFRENYCLDSMIDKFREGTTYSRGDYLRNLVFPDATVGFGPAIRAADFSELLVADFIEENYKYWVPSIRYSSKMVRNESPKGTDVLGFKFKNPDYTLSPNDRLLSVEVKTQFSGKAPRPRLQQAVIDSAKDAFRKGEALNAIKQKLINVGKAAHAMRVQRFQDPLGYPYIENSGAAALFNDSVFNKGHIHTTTDCQIHNNVANLRLLVIKSKDFMKLVHSLYDRACNEA